LDDTGSAEIVRIEWTRVADPDELVEQFPAWLSGRMPGARGSFGLLFATGDVMLRVVLTLR
jgi:hypothetical protein